MQYTIRQYAELKNLAVNTIYHKIKIGLLKTKIKNGMKYVVVDDEQPTITDIEQPTLITSTEDKQNEIWAKARAEKAVLQMELQKEKLKKLRVDTELAKQKNLLNIEYMKKEICEAVFNCYCQSFVDFKNYIIQLRLETEQLNALNNILNNCIDNFQKKLKQYIKQKENIDQNEQSKDNKNEKTVKHKSNKRISK